MEYWSAMESIHAIESINNIEISNYSDYKKEDRKRILDTYKAKAKKATAKTGLATYGDVVESLKRGLKHGR